MSIENRDGSPSQQTQIFNGYMEAVFSFTCIVTPPIPFPCEITDLKMIVQTSVANRFATISIARFIPSHGLTFIPIGLSSIDIAANVFSNVGVAGYSIFNGLKLLEGDHLMMHVSGGSITGVVTSLVVKKLQDRVTYFGK